MSQAPAKGERATAIVSTLVAVVILAAGVTAQQSHTGPQDELALLESDFRFQLDNAFRHNVKGRTERMAQLEEVLSAWRQSSQSQEDRKRLASWLLEATIRSMPGSTESLSRGPEFGVPKTNAPVEPVESQVEQPTLTVSETPEQTAPQATTVDGVVEVSNPVPLEETPDVFPQENKAEFLESTSSSKEKSIEINLTELAVRIADYHAGLDRIETALLTSNSPKLDFLEKQMQQIENLTQNFRFTKLYHEALSDKERPAIRELRSMGTTLAEFERLLGDRAEGEQNGDFLGSFDTSHQERVEKLRQRLAAIANHTT